MKRLDFRVILGAVLILGGILALLEKMGIVTGGMSLFGGAVFGLAGLAFLYVLVTDQAQWWAAIPAFTLLGMSASSFPGRPGTGWPSWVASAWASG